MSWIFAQRLAGHSVTRITRALNDAGIPCPSAAGPGRNPHRTAASWTLGTVTTILGNPRYTGRQVWNRQRTDSELADPANTSLGHKSVHRWNLPDGWVISDRPAHPALVSEAGFIAAQDISAARGPAPVITPAVPGTRRYLLAGLLACGTCGRRMESAWSNGKAAYRCRHGHTSAAAPDPARPKNAYIREDRIRARALVTVETTANPVDGWTSPYVGEDVCTDGSFTLENCNAQVATPSRCFTYKSGVYVCGLEVVASTNGSTLGVSGDSGGPVYAKDGNTFDGYPTVSATGAFSGIISPTQIVMTDINQAISWMNDGTVATVP